MYMNSSEYEFNKMTTVATMILESFEAAGVSVKHRCWSETYHSVYMENPFHELVEDTYRDTRSK